MTESAPLPLVEACEALLSEHGDTYLGVGWTKSQENTDVRYGVMLDLIRRRTEPVSLLDFGCGTGHLLEYIRARGMDGIDYHGLDVSTPMIDTARAKFPGIDFRQLDVLADDTDLPVYDYVVMNGLFTYRGPMSFEEAVAHWRRLLTAVMPHVGTGLAFNASSPYVDWERDDLFHLPLSLATDTVAQSPCPYFVVRHDYGLYETTVYAYRTIGSS